MFDGFTQIYQNVSPLLSNSLDYWPQVSSPRYTLHAVPKVSLYTLRINLFFISKENLRARKLCLILTAYPASNSKQHVVIPGKLCKNYYLFLFCIVLCIAVFFSLEDLQNSLSIVWVMKYYAFLLSSFSDQVSTKTNSQLNYCVGIHADIHQ